MTGFQHRRFHSFHSQERSGAAAANAADFSAPQHVLSHSFRTSRDLKMERQRQRFRRHLDTGIETELVLDSDCSPTDDPAASTEPVITPPRDFQDSCQPAIGYKDVILEPPAMFRPSAVPVRTRIQRPKTDLFWTSEDSKWIFPPWPATAGVQCHHDIDSSHRSSLSGTTQETFNQELERLKSHSLFLRFPLGGPGGSHVQYRSSRSVVEYCSSFQQYRYWNHFYLHQTVR